MRAGIAALLLLTLAGAAPGDEPPAPPHGTLEVPERVWNAGKVMRGTPLRHAFVLKNVGTAELSVDAKPG